MLSSSQGDSSKTKTVYLVRHGESTHNAQSFRWQGADYNSPLYLDAPLTPFGEDQANKISTRIRDTNAQLIVTSPFTRAIQTMVLATQQMSPRPPIIVNKLCAERLGASCDIGSSVEELERRFPELDFSDVQPRDAWWWTATNDDRKPTSAAESLKLLTRASYNRSIIGFEPSPSVMNRVHLFRSWLLARPEQRIVVFAHGLFLYHFDTSNDYGHFDNCEIRKITLYKWF